MPLECFNRRTHLNVIVNSTSTYLIIDVGWGCMHIYLFFLFDMWLNSCLSIFFKSKQKINKGHSHNYYFVEFYRTGTCEMCIYTGWNIHDCVSHYECGNSRLFSFLSAFTGWVHWITSHGIFCDIVVSLFIYLFIYFFFVLIF